MQFKSKLISTAVMAAFGVAAGTAHAVNLAADGVGEALIYPYYTVQTKNGNAFDTYISVVNSDSVNGKAVKVRFIEGKASREVLDFNLYLSPNDVWTGAITRDASGNAIIRTWDNSCTAPEIPLNAGTGAREASFVNFGYAGDAVKDDSLARAKEGYVEIIQMGDLVANVKTDGLEAGSIALDTFAAAKHSAGVPANCAAIRTAWLTNDYGVPANDGIRPLTGGLSGAGTIINVGEGTDITYDAVAIDSFRDAAAGAAHFAPGSIQPNFGDVDPAVSVVFDGADVVRTDWTAEEPASVPVSAILMRDSIINEYAVAAAPVGLSTDWVITMPTKLDHVTQVLAADKAPFTSTLGTTGACEAISLAAFNREEGMQTSGLQFSPTQSGGSTSLCWEANVVSMSNSGTVSDALGSVNTRLTLPVPFSEGWLKIGFAQSRTAPAASSARINTYTGVETAGTTPVYTGLPVVGFAAMTFVNTSTLANYGGSYTHRYTRNIAP